MGLHFKGEKPKKKTKSKSRSTGGPAKEDPDAHLEGWIPAPSPALLLGPSYLTLPATDLTPAVCVALNPTTGKVYPHVLPSAGTESSAAALSRATSSAAQLASLDPEELEALVDPSDAAALGLSALEHSEPNDVNHVWVCARIPDTNDKVTFRSGGGKFLACDEYGRISAEREARGMQEEWTLEEPAGGKDGAGSGRIVIKSAYGKYLSVDVVAGGKVELRGDEEKESATERWRLMMQGEYVVKAKKQYNDRNGIKTVADTGYTVVTDLAGAEIDAMCVPVLLPSPPLLTDRFYDCSKKYHHHGRGADAVGTEEDKRALKKARKEGKLAEAMLDRRAKLKR